MQRLNKDNKGLINRLNRLIERRQFKDVMKKVSFGLSCAAVFIAVYVLVTPALTIEYPLECGKEEHVHTDECYGMVQPVTMVCNIAEGSGADVILHKHNQYCYDNTGKLICTLEEIEGHTHTASCYSLVPEFDPEEETPAVGDEGQSEAPGTEGSVPEAPQQTPGQEASDKENPAAENAGQDDSTQTGSPAQAGKTETEGKTEQTEPAQTKPENGSAQQVIEKVMESEIKHLLPQHTEQNSEAQKAPEAKNEQAEKKTEQKTAEPEKTAKKWDRVLIAGLDTVIPMSSEPVCGEEELTPHTHTDACYDENGKLICGKKQVIEHQHTAACVVEGEAEFGLICGKEEHEHTDACRMGFIPESGKPIDVDMEYTLTTDKVIAKFHAKGTATLAEDVEVPEGAALSFTATQVEDETKYEVYEEELLADEENLGVLGIDIFAYDMSYGGCELDLSEVDVMCEVTPTEQLIEYAEASAENNGIMTLEDGIEPAANDAADAAPAELGFMMLASTAETEPKESAITEDSKLDVVMRNAKEVRVAIIQTANPSFTVQYYAPIKRVVNETSDKKYEAIPIIDTDGGKLPKNGQTPAQKNIYVEATNTTWTPKTVLMEEELTEIYKSREFSYLRAPNLKYFNVVERDALAEKSSYNLDEIWVLKPNCDPASIDPADWDHYAYDTDLQFTNRQESATGSRMIYIAEGSVIRLVYGTKHKTHSNPVDFYDYNISDGNIYSTPADAWKQQNPKTTTSQTDTKKWYMNTVKKGINDPANYDGTGAKLGFGNTTNGTTMNKESWGGQTLNAGNEKNYGSCTFELTTGTITKDGQEYVQYNSGIAAPKLFNEPGGTDSEVVGKKSHIDEYQLLFDQLGDSYVLQSVKKNQGNTLVADGLSNLQYRQNWNKTKKIWTNNFWPMDDSTSHGTDGNDMVFGSTSKVANRKSVKLDANGQPVEESLAESDDGKDHNGFFGMNFAVEFELTKDYVGPLDYYFFGDDDMWIFLNGELVCDIGGVHGSTGEYVNLWDHINMDELESLPEDQSKKYRLSFFYTERGASGSTCWMQFTLPTVVGVNLIHELEEQNDAEHGALWVDKTVDGFADPDAEFTFQLELFTKDPVSGEETPLPDNYNADVLVKDETGAIVKTDKNEVLHAGSQFTLKDGGAVTLYNLPVMYGERPVYYRVTEVGADGFLSSYSVSESIIKASAPGAGNGDSATDVYGSSCTGQITANYLDKVSFVNHASYELPETGGEGTTMYTFAGLLCLIAAASILYKNKVKASKK